MIIRLCLVVMKGSTAFHTVSFMKSLCLDLKKENVHLEEQYFDVIDSKTENGIRKVPIADKLLPYYKDWYNSCHDCEYLLHTEDGKRFLYRNYYDSYWTPLVEQI